MKKTFRINIGGYIFNIDEDAYEMLSDYLNRISQYFGQNNEGKEIIADIEQRISELFQEKINENKEVITIDDVDNVVTTMGKPEQLAEFDQPDDQFEYSDDKGTKMMYRDPDNRVLGGVCSGLGNYFNMDPLIIRILFLIAFLVYGSGSLIYIILWIILPLARTTAQKLAMKGEAVNVNNIQKFVKEEYTEVKQNFSNWRHSKGYKSTQHGLDDFGNLILSVLRVGVKILIVLIAITFIFTGLVTIGSLLFAFFADLSVISPDIISDENISLYTFSKFFISGNQSLLFYISLLTTLIIPFIALTYLGFKIIIKFKANDKIFFISSAIVWFVGLIFLIYTSWFIAGNFKQSTTDTKEYVIKSKSDTLYLQTMANEQFIESNKITYTNKINIDDNMLLFDKNNNQLLVHPQLNIYKSADSLVKIIVTVTTRGKNKKQALENINASSYNWTQMDSVLKFDPYLITGPSKLFNFQRVRISVYVPEGKTVYMNSEMKNIIYDIDNVENMWDGHMTEKYWHMTPEGLTTEKNEINIKINGSEIKHEINNTIKDLKEELKNLN